jgi:proteasome beta subunit
LNEEKQLKTGTTTVAIVCRDGVILAADKRVTAGYIANKRFRKILNITDNIAVTVAGSVSEVQLLSRLIQAELRLKDLQTKRITNVKEAANLLAGMVFSNFRRMAMMPAITGFLMGGRDESGQYAYEIGIDGSIMKIDDYTSDGSGSFFAIGVLEQEFKKDLSIDEGVKLATRAINAAIQRDPSSGNGIDVVAITTSGVKTVLEKELIVRLDV